MYTASKHVSLEFSIQPFADLTVIGDFKEQIWKGCRVGLDKTLGRNSLLSG